MITDPYQELDRKYAAKGEGYYDLSRPEMLPYIPEHAKTILEVGCGAGSFGKLIKESRPDVTVWGIEPNGELASIAGKQIDRLIAGTFGPDVPELKGRRFDCVVFNDVLEHMAEPERALTAAKEYLSPEGMVAASIPNILYFPEITNILISQDWKYADWGVLDNTHLRFFTKKSILRLFEEAGFDVRSVNGINPCWGKKYHLANFLLLNHLRDWKYQQFAVQAAVRSK